MANYSSKNEKHGQANSAAQRKTEENDWTAPTSRGVSPRSCKYLKIEHRGKINVFSMHFPSLLELVRFLEKEPTRNKEVFAEAQSSTSPEAFAGPSLEKSLEYCVSGYDQGYEKFLQFQRQLESVNQRQFTRRKTENSFVGQRPNVPAYVAGAPKNMIRMRKVEQKKMINIFMNVAFSSSMTQEQIQYRGIITMNLIRILEANGYIVNFRMFEACMVKDEIFICEIGLKKPGEKLEPRICYFPMCGKSFERRIIARIKESIPFREHWGMSYGNVMSESYVKLNLNISDQDIYIGSPTEMNIQGLNIYDDADAFMEKCNLQKHIVVPRYHDALKKLMEE